MPLSAVAIWNPGSITAAATDRTATGRPCATSARQVAVITARRRPDRMPQRGGERTKRTPAPRVWRAADSTTADSSKRLKTLPVVRDGNTAGEALAERERAAP